MKTPIVDLAPVQMLPLKPPTASTFRPSSTTSPKRPSRTCQASTPAHSPEVGGCAKVHGQGMSQLQTSNQSPLAYQLGIFSTIHLLGAGNLLDLPTWPESVQKIPRTRRSHGRAPG